MLFDLDKSGKILKNVQVDFSRGKLQLLIIWNINCINCSEHVLRVKRGGGGGRFTHKIASPTDIHICSTSSNCNPWIWCVFSLLLLLLCGAFIVNVFLAVHIRALPLDLCVWKSPRRRIPTLADRWRGVCRLFGQHSLGTRTIRLGWSPEAKGSTNGSCGAPGLVRGHHRSSWTRDGKRRPCWLKGAEETCSEPSCVCAASSGVCTTCHNPSLYRSKACRLCGRESASSCHCCWANFLSQPSNSHLNGSHLTKKKNQSN